MILYNISHPHNLEIIVQNPSWIKNIDSTFSSMLPFDATLTLEYPTKIPIYYVYAINSFSFKVYSECKDENRHLMQSELEKAADTVINIVP